jgi:phosphoenolpyruvate carboxykinase (ATP)
MFIFSAGGIAMFDTVESEMITPIIHAELAKIGLRWIKNPSWNEDVPTLHGYAVANDEATLAEHGALLVATGQHTGRSPKDKFIVLDDTTAHTVWWDNNLPISRHHFDILKADFMVHARLKSLFIQDLEAGADPLHMLPTRIITEHAWHALFMRHLLKPSDDANFKPQLTIINLPSFKADPARHGTHSETVIAFDLQNKLVLIGGTHYAGEMKKAVFTVLNYLLPAAHVLPMHCSANVNAEGDTAIFFGLSGTGKTTLSAEPTRTLIGDDEHGWSDDGIFNFENGCYAKVINLSAQAEPEIFKAAQQFATVLENVGFDNATRSVDFNNSSQTENTRAAYPLSAIANASKTRRASAPTAIIMLTADAFGVLPPIALLDEDDAMKQFLAGYTAKLAGTERGVKTPEATFSACFGAPFLPRHPQVYADLLKAFMSKNKTRCYLLNTGWTGGGYGIGSRMPLDVTRKILAAALSGALENVATRVDESFGLRVPLQIEGIDEKLLNPRQCWQDTQAYDQAAENLSSLYKTALAKFSVPQNIVQQAAE